MFGNAVIELKTFKHRGLASLAGITTPSLALTGVFAGLAGGLVEVIWIGLYSGVSGTSGLDVARHIADTVFPGVLHLPGAAALGLAIHFGLSAVLGLLLVGPLRRAALRRLSVLFPICFGIFGLIWSVNFMLVLPMISPTFPALLPVWVTLVSKLLFGAAVASVLGHNSTKAHVEDTTQQFVEFHQSLITLDATLS